MKNSLKRASLLWLSLLWAFWMIAFINVTNWENSVTIQTSWLSSEHKTRLHSLYLWNGTETTGAWLRVSEWRKNLDFWNGIIVWNSSSSNYVVVGWWENNTVNANNSWIGWWRNNTVNWSNSVIGWWMKNKAATNSVVVWWNDGESSANGVIVWWHDGVSSNGGVVLWGGTKANWNSIVLWKGAEWWNWSFAFGGKAWDNSAYINAQYWLLVWTTTPISNVPLVVEWAVKIGMVNPSIVWEIGNNNGCIKANDGEKNIVLGRSSWAAWWACGWLGSCQFGWVLIQDGDSVTVYAAPYSTNCTSKTFTCHNWNLGLSNPYIYPYCYTITSDPVYKW